MVPGCRPTWFPDKPVCGGGWLRTDQHALPTQGARYAHTHCHTAVNTGDGGIGHGQRDGAAHSPAARHRPVGHDNTPAYQPTGNDCSRRTDTELRRNIDHEPVAKRCIGIGNTGTRLSAVCTSYD
jgi:hypothetical protein